MHYGPPSVLFILGSSWQLWNTLFGAHLLLASWEPESREKASRLILKCSQGWQPLLHAAVARVLSRDQEHHLEIG